MQNMTRIPNGCHAYSGNQGACRTNGISSSECGWLPTALQHHALCAEGALTQVVA